MSGGTCAALALQLRTLKLPSFVMHHEEVARKAESEGSSFVQYLSHLVELELSDREVRKIERLRKRSGLPMEKTLANLDQQRLPAKVRRQIPTLCEGGFAERAENVLAFGMPGAATEVWEAVRAAADDSLSEVRIDSSPASR